MFSFIPPVSYFPPAVLSELCILPGTLEIMLIPPSLHCLQPPPACLVPHGTLHCHTPVGSRTHAADENMALLPSNN